jgi:two-component system response regulator YesN
MKKRILIVDDDTEITDMLKLTLDVWCPECRVVLANNGLEALIQLQLRDGIQPFDIVLTDYEMPFMNGLDLAEEIRQKWPNTHIILMSGGQIDKNMQQEDPSRKFDSYIKKPFIMQQIKQIFLGDPGILH